MVFINNKYTKIYYNIINSVSIIENTYVEKHHILPVSLGGTNEKHNLVNLTARQHFICHWLLTKMVNGEAKKKMIFALNRMLSYSANQKRYKITGRKYEMLKIKYNKINLFNDKEWQKNQRQKNHQGKKRTEETKQKLRDAWAKNKENRVGVNHPSYGREVTLETKMKQSQAMKGKLIGDKNPFYGKHHSQETKQKLRNFKLGKTWIKPAILCSYCNKTVDNGNFKRWHGDKCKLKN